MLCFHKSTLLKILNKKLWIAFFSEDPQLDKNHSSPPGGCDSDDDLGPPGGDSDDDLDPPESEDGGPAPKWPAVAADNLPDALTHDKDHIKMEIGGYSFDLGWVAWMSSWAIQLMRA